jgi:hypothetical protein
MKQFLIKTLTSKSHLLHSLAEYYGGCAKAIDCSTNGGKETTYILTLNHDASGYPIMDRYLRLKLSFRKISGISLEEID